MKKHNAIIIVAMILLQCMPSIAMTKSERRDLRQQLSNVEIELKNLPEMRMPVKKRLQRRKMLMERKARLQERLEMMDIAPMPMKKPMPMPAPMDPETKRYRKAMMKGYGKEPKPMMNPMMKPMPMPKRKMDPETKRYMKAIMKTRKKK